MSDSTTMRRTAILEVVGVVAVAFLTRGLLRLWGFGIAAGAAATIVAALAATWLLRRRGSNWARLGLRRPEKIGSTALWTVGLALVALLVVPALSAAIADALHSPAQQLEVFARLRGNLGFYLLMLFPGVWGAAAFGEELVYRGFIMQRLGDALGGGRPAALGALLLQAVLFGLGHAYLGPRGVLNAGLLGLVSGLCFQLNGRNFWPLFIAHGLVDTIGITVLYLGLAHG
ncbi:MAG: CPBP family intramembrane metalloprotease [Proteobacteria bacterium]|nr:CPBP family intramembrane metalloprotease [Pseudomonadota bacterium]